MKRLVLSMIVLLSLAGCDPLKPANGDPSQVPSDPCGADVNLQACWGAATPPGTGKHRAGDLPVPPGFHRVLVTFTALNVGGVGQNFPVHVLAQGRTLSGSLAVDARTGSPFTVYNDITTPDTLFYDLGPGVVHLDVQAIRLGLAGEILSVETLLDGHPWPGGKFSIQNPLEMGSEKRTQFINVKVDVPPL